MDNVYASLSSTSMETEEHGNGRHRACPPSLPPALLALPRRVPPLVPRDSTLSYLCLSSLNDGQHPHQRRSDCSVLEVALTACDERRDETLGESPSCSAYISLADMHGLFSRQRATSCSPSTQVIALHPVFQHRRVHQQFRLFVVVFHHGPPESAPDPPILSTSSTAYADTENAVRVVHEAMRLAVTAHTGAATAAAENEDSLMCTCSYAHLCDAALHIHCLVSHLFPCHVVSSCSLGMTMTSSTEWLAKSHDASSTAEPTLPISLRWSWVPAPDVEVSAKKVDPTSSTFPALVTAQLALSHGGPNSTTHLVPLWQYWTAALTAAPNTGADGAEALPSTDIFKENAVYHRLRRYAHSARKVFFCRINRCVTANRHQRSAERLMCALLAVLSVAREQEAFWASPLIPLHLQSPHVLDRHLLVWFTFIGCETNTNAVVQELQTSLKAVLLSQREGMNHTHCSRSTPLMPLQLSVQLRLRCLCKWITTKLMDATLRWLPPSLCVRKKESDVVPSSIFQGNETHLLFRAAREPLQEVSTPSHYHPRHHDGRSALAPTSASSSSQHQQQPLPPQASTALSTRLFDDLFRCVTSEAGTSSEADPIFSWRLRQPRPALLHSLFAHPSQHGVAVCRVHVGNALTSAWREAPSPFSCGRVMRCRPVAALLVWYAVDFEDVFCQAFRRWALTRRYAPLLRERGGLDAGDLPVDAAVVCCTSRGASTTHGCLSGADRSTGENGAALTLPPLGLLGRCLLLGLWMRLKLRDVDLGEGEGEGEDEDEDEDAGRTRTGGGSVMVKMVQRCAQGTPTCGTLYYSSRRNMLFARDWHTVQQLHRVIDARRHDHAISTESATKEKGAMNAFVAATVLQAFGRARLSQRQRQRRVLLQVRQMRAAVVLQAWLRAALSCLLVCQLHDAQRSTCSSRHPSSSLMDSSTASAAGFSVVGTDDAQEECILLHWSAVEEASVNSIPSSRAATPLVCAIAMTRTQTPFDEPSGGGSRPALTPTRALAGETSFAASTEEEGCCNHGGDETTSSLSGVAVSPPRGLAPLPLPLGQRHLCDLEAHERALLWRMALSELLWYTSLGECGGRRALEAREALEWQRIIADTTEVCSSTYAAKTARVGTTRKMELCSTRFAARLHNDETLPSSLSINTQSGSIEESLLGGTVAMTRCVADEKNAREVMYETEDRFRTRMYAAHLRQHTVIIIEGEEQRQRGMLNQLWELEQCEWQARWSAVVLPECVLRGLYRDAFAEELPYLHLEEHQQHPQSLPTRASRDAEAEVVEVVGSRAQNAGRSSSSPATDRISARVTSAPSVSRGPTSTLLEAARAHRAFLLHDGDDDCAELSEPRTHGCVALPASTHLRRSASPIPQPPNDGGDSNGTMPSPAPPATPLHQGARLDSSARAAGWPATQAGESDFCTSYSPTVSQRNCNGGDVFHVSPQQPRRSPSVAHAAPATPNSRQTAVPVVAVSLRSEDADGDVTPLRERHVNKLSRTQTTTCVSRRYITHATSTPDTFASTTPPHTLTPARRPDPVASAVTSSSSALTGWWYVPLNDPCDDHIEKQRSRVAKTTTTTMTPLLLSPSTNHGGSLSGAKAALRLPDESATTTRCTAGSGAARTRSAKLFLRRRVTKETRKTGDEDDVASAVAAAIALACDSSGACGRGLNLHGVRPPSSSSMSRSTAKRTSEQALSLPVKPSDVLTGSTAMGKNSIADACRLSRPPRKRYVTWADDVQEH